MTWGEEAWVERGSEGRDRLEGRGHGIIALFHFILLSLVVIHYILIFLYDIILHKKRMHIMDISWPRCDGTSQFLHSQWTKQNR